MAYGKKAHLIDNIEAIATVFQLEKEERKATASEREILSRYSGFGGLKCILNPTPPERLKTHPVGRNPNWICFPGLPTYIA